MYLEMSSGVWMYLAVFRGVLRCSEAVVMYLEMLSGV